MKRFHIHIGVDNLADSIRFYNAQFFSGEKVAEGSCSMPDKIPQPLAVIQNQNQLGVADNEH
ncbi:hypothetical protein [Legionella bononiensis]|uniref:Glyoxalase/bleomycin resistance protein/dioxygenase n=1 Tax=Legionella bononiensis TaxID=2793102 RepID=A0ABS1WAP8_9GAMM|nr:hypothetical protein [Legionella bononiensis]MBL7480337.1 hypothetical protein [Legionella bononiensis]MBL7526431.1 hypothetical protein [Legionella bononiensis]MBL7563075.1 hypothetical protein [Legionella bononiensis]